ncbi:MAG: M28 family peptidase [Gemmatimonadales bacterium]
MKSSAILATLALLVAACSSNPDGGTPPTIATISLSQTAATLAPGETLQLTATPRDGAGTAISGQTITWSTSESSVATVSTSGLVTGVAAGTATIIAATGGKTAASTVTVAVVSASCSTQVVTVASMLVACIQQDSLWKRMTAFQQIADANPGPDGHASRNSGEPGYLASVNYVADLMRAAGYRVTVQLYTFRYSAGGIVDPNRADYNLIADSPYGDTNHVVVVDAHLDAIFGAGMLDNASGSATILEIALHLAHTPTRNQLRYIWFGGEELGLLGSFHYTQTLASTDLSRIAFDIDADVTATPNYVIGIADPANSSGIKTFPTGVVTASQRGNDDFISYFTAAGLPYERLSNDGTDSYAFAQVGVPNTGILTAQDCCKSQAEVNLFGGFTGNFEGHVPSFDGGCVDRSKLWCDNLSNNDPQVLTTISKAFASVVFALANDPALGGQSIRTHASAVPANANR